MFEVTIALSFLSVGYIGWKVNLFMKWESIQHNQVTEKRRQKYKELPRYISIKFTVQIEETVKKGKWCTNTHRTYMFD